MRIRSQSLVCGVHWSPAPIDNHPHHDHNSHRPLARALQVYLIDPPSSSLASFIATGTMAASPGSTIAEGIGIGRLTANFAAAKDHVTAAFQGTDAELLHMAYYLLHREGVFVGPSAALNVVGAVKAARALGPGHTIVTVLCDGGDRYRSKVYNAAWLKERGMAVPDVDAGRDHADFVA